METEDGDEKASQATKTSKNRKKGKKGGRGRRRSHGRKVLLIMKRPAAKQPGKRTKPSAELPAAEVEPVCEAKPKKSRASKSPAKAVGKEGATEPTKRSKRGPATPARSKGFDEKKSFARRFAPNMGFPLLKWATLREAFYLMAYAKVDRPSSFEASAIKDLLRFFAPSVIILLNAGPICLARFPFGISLRRIGRTMSPTR